MKVTPDEVIKAFKGLGMSIARVREMAEEQGREGLFRGMPRRQEDSIRQVLLDATRDLDRITRVVRGTDGSPKKTS